MVKYENKNLDIHHNRCISAGVNEEIVNMVKEKVESYNIFKNVYVTRAGATISSHCGRNTLGVLFVKKNKK